MKISKLFSIKNENIVLTGISGNLGYEYSRSLLENGCNTVLGNNPKNLVEIVTNKLSEQLSFNSQLYGSGDTSDYIVEEIINTKL